MKLLMVMISMRSRLLLRRNLPLRFFLKKKGESDLSQSNLLPLSSALLFE